MKLRFSGRDVVIGVVAAGLVLAFVAVSTSMHSVGFPLDDAWIHQTYARNLAEHGEWAFYSGQSSAGSTAPLYTVLLAIGRVIGIPFYVWTFGLGALALAGAGWSGARMAERLFPDAVRSHVGLLTGLALVLTWHLVWAAASGMETMLFGTLSLVVIALAWREQDADPLHWQAAAGRGAAFGVVGALLTLTRPEGMGLVALACGGVGLAQFRSGGRERQWAWLVWTVGVLGGWLVGIFPYLMLNYQIEGTLLPNTSAAKQAEYAVLRDAPLWKRYIRLLLPILAGGQFLLIPGIVVGVWVVARRAVRTPWQIVLLLPIAWGGMHLSAYALRLPASYQHGRYVMPVLPHLLLYSVGGTLAILQVSQKSVWQRVLSRSLALAVVCLMPGFLVIGAQQYGRDVRLITTEMVATAKWINEHVPSDDLLAVHDIGAVGYYAPRPILDLAGLVSPEIVPIIRDHEALMRLMCERSAAYLMVFPDQRPVEPDDPRLGTEWEVDSEQGERVIRPIFRTETPYAIEEGGKNMAVYHLEWGGTCE